MIIPHDTGKPWRFNQAINYIGNFPDEIGSIINSWLDHSHASNDQKLWWIFLYSTCYCMGSAMILSTLLDYRNSDLNYLKAFWKVHKPKLIFQSDRRYIKNCDQFVEIVYNFVNLTQGRPYEYIMQFVTDDPEQTYSNLYNEVNRWKYYKRFGTILFIFNLCKIFPHIQVESKTYDWKSGATTTSAIFNLLYQDDLADRFDAEKLSLTVDDITMLNFYLQIITAALQKKFPQKHWNLIYVSSDLCSFRKLFKGTRYLGYYVDRQQEEIQVLQNNYPEFYEIWNFVWNARSKFIDHIFLGELHNWNGIRKKRMKLFKDYGYIGADPDFKES